MTNISNFLKTLLAVLVLGLPLFYILYRDSEKLKHQALIDSTLANDARLSKVRQKQNDSLRQIIQQQQKTIFDYETRLKAVSQRTDSIYHLYDNLIIVRPRY